MACDNCENFFKFPDDMTAPLRHQFTLVCSALLGKCDESQMRETVVETALEEIELFMSAKLGYATQNWKKLSSCLVQAEKCSQAVQLLEMRLSISPSDECDYHLLIALGKVYKRSGEYQTALGYYENANAIAGRSDDHAQLAASLAKMGVCYFNLQNPEAAKQYLGLSLEMLEFCKMENRETAKDFMISVYKEIAYLQGLVNSGFESSKSFYEEALKIVQNGTSSSDLKVCKLLSLISYCFSMLNDRPSVERYNSSVVFLVENVLKNVSCVKIHVRSLIRILSRAAYSYEVLELFDQELDVRIKALKLSRKYLGDAHPEVARLASGVFKTSHRLRKPDDEVDDYLAICQTSLKDCGYQKNPQKSKLYVRHVTDALSNCADVFAKVRFYWKAQNYYNEALAVNRDVFGEIHPRMGKIMKKMGHLYIRWGQRRSAKESLQKCLNIYEIYKPHNVIFLDSLREELDKV